MEKCNAVQEGRTPCRICANGNSEFVCSKCAGEKIAQKDSKLDVEKIAEEHTNEC